MCSHEVFRSKRGAEAVDPVRYGRDARDGGIKDGIPWEVVAFGPVDLEADVRKLQFDLGEGMREEGRWAYYVSVIRNAGEKKRGKL